MSGSPLPPGMFFKGDFLDAKVGTLLEEMAVSLQESIEEEVKTAPRKKAAAHNLDEGLTEATSGSGEYRPLMVSDPNSEKNRRLPCQAFVGYGDDGHMLTYFMRPSAIPTLVLSHLIPRVGSQMVDLGVVENIPPEGLDQSGNWRLSLNAYTSTAQNSDDDNVRFGWHTDIEANGNVTTITSLLAPSALELRPKGAQDPVARIDLAPRSLLILSGESRWDWEHRVVAPSSPPVSSLGTSWHRFSLVLGH